MLTTAEKLWEDTRSLPEPLLIELLDFDDFLQAKRGVVASTEPSLHLSSLYGGLESSNTFMAYPLTIQRQMCVDLF